MTSFVTPAIDDKKWIVAIETIFEDLVDHPDTRERRIILEGLAGIYVRLEEFAGQEHMVRENTETTQQTCIVVNLEAYRRTQQSRKGTRRE